MARSLSILLVAVLVGCSSAPPDADGGFVDAGPTPVEPLDSGSQRNPNIAPGLGAFTGAYDVNGAGELFALQVDDHLALELNDAQHLFLGTIDGTAFDAGLIYPELASCGVGALVGAFDRDGGYAATESFCAGGQQVSAPISGQRFSSPNVYRQELAWSGAYDATETGASANGCAAAASAHPLIIGVARDLDGGAVTALLTGDGLAEELVFGAVDADTGVLNARAKDSAGGDTSSFSLYFLVDGGVAGTRAFHLGPDAGDCDATVDFTGAKR